MVHLGLRVRGFEPFWSIWDLGYEVLGLFGMFGAWGTRFWAFLDNFGLQNRAEMRCGTEPVLRHYGTHPEIVASQPGSEVLDYLSGYSYD